MLTTEQANSIYDILVAEVGAAETQRDMFVYHQTDGDCVEYRFCGSLGFGGKFWRTYGRRNDGTWGDIWYVNYYSEDDTAERARAKARANMRLSELTEKENNER